MLDVSRNLCLQPNHTLHLHINKLDFGERLKQLSLHGFIFICIGLLFYNAEAIKDLWNIKTESFVLVWQYVCIVKNFRPAKHACFAVSVILGFLYNLSEQYLTSQSSLSLSFI